MTWVRALRFAGLALPLLFAAEGRAAPTKGEAAKAPATSPPPGQDKGAAPATNPSPNGASPAGFTEAKDAPAAAPASPGAEPAEVTRRDDDPRALEEFRPQLDPYGDWVHDATYGEVWIPSRAVVGDRFAPYVSSGRWEADAAGRWVWVSEYPFGNIVFHYGRWAWTRYGWAWIPGYRYAPAWVEWRLPEGGYDYVGWTPAPPTYVWVDGVAVVYGYPAPYYWAFCPWPYLFYPYPYHYVVAQPVHLHHTRHYVPTATPGSAGPHGDTALAGRRATSAAMAAPGSRAVPAGYREASRSGTTTGVVERSGAVAPPDGPVVRVPRAAAPPRATVPVAHPVMRAPPPVRAPAMAPRSPPRLSAPPARVYSPPHVHSVRPGR